MDGCCLKAAEAGVTLVGLGARSVGEKVLPTQLSTFGSQRYSARLPA